MGEKKQDSAKLYCDNKLAITLTKNSMYLSWIKHFSIKYYYLREIEVSDEILLKFYNIEE